MTPELEATLARLPDHPGVYLFKGASGNVLYVGKAQSLRHRVRSYWQRRGARGGSWGVFSVDQVVSIEWTLTDTVSEALLLEANLIKRHQPTYNARLKDDKSYPFIKITLAEDFPRIERTRRLVPDGSRYFGPYASVTSVDSAMDLIRRLFPFRTCTIPIRDGERALPRPCLLYDIKRCQGPCIQAISKADYRRDIEQVMLFLEGRQEQVTRHLRREMETASEALDYERAAALRDQLRAVERTTESQKMAAYARTQQDVLGLARGPGEAAVQLFVVRGGRMIGRDVFTLVSRPEVPDDEVLAAFIKQYYASAASIPPAILLPSAPAEAEELEAFLGERRGSRTRLSVPQRGEKRQLVALANRNAEEALARDQARRMADRGQLLGALEELADALGMAAAPVRVECYDISTIQGTDTVGSMVVFVDGRPASGQYRRFRIRSVQGTDDFASHREVLRRRFRRAAMELEEGTPADEARWRMPDLVLIDGGKGQVSAAKEVLDDLGLHDLPLAGIAKQREELFLPGVRDPVVLPATSPALQLVQRLRDEAHRFAITYHRSLRGRRQTRSVFDELPGLGPKRRRALLRAFGSVRRIREASVEELSAVPGIGRALAERLHEALPPG
ncbi:MAG: excinuclease ABC subunit UvrC [Candidatus Limnocylindrales bacterium]